MKWVLGTFLVWLMATGKFKTYLALAQRGGTAPTVGQSLNSNTPGFTDQTIALKTLTGSLLPSVSGATSLGQ